MNGTTPDFASTVPLVSATPVEPEKPPRIVQRETSMKLALETKVSFFLIINIRFVIKGRDLTRNF